MEAYTDFASVYDTFMDETPYEAWFLFLKERLTEAGIENGLLLELGCGTGTMTQLLEDAGYDMIGVDNSIEMLEEANRKKIADNRQILYLLQDMQEFELYGTVRAVISVCDSINYLTEPEALIQCFKLVNNYLDPGGLFLFDFNTVHKYRDMIGDTVIAENRDTCSFIWENGYDGESRINEYDLTLFIKEENSSFYHKYVETHYQRGYELDEIKGYLEKAGLVFVAAYDDYTKKTAHPDSERILVIARENGK